jgi:thymidylate synthase (FAD)
MDSHAQLEIRQYANAMFEIVKQVCPVSCEAFEDYVLNAKRFSRMEMQYIYRAISDTNYQMDDQPNPTSMTDNEWKDFLKKISM